MKKSLVLAAILSAAVVPLCAEEGAAPGAVPAAASPSLAHIASKTSVHGYVSTDYYGGVLVNDASGKNKIVPSFEQLRFVFGFLSELSDDFVFNSEVEFEHATRVGVKTTAVCSTCTPQVLSSASAGLEIEVEQAWVEYRRHAWLRPRVGVILPPIGRLNINHDSDTVATVERPISDQQIMPTTWYEPGLGFTGQAELGMLGVSYEAYLINGLAASAKDAGNETKLRDMRMHKRADNDTNTDKAMVGRVALQAFGAELGFSGYRGAYDPSGALFMTYGAVDALYRIGGLELQGEWLSLSTDLPSPADFVKSDPVATPFAGLRQGWYAQILYSLPCGSWGALQPFVNVSQIDPNVEIATANDQTRLTYGLNYRPIDSLVLKLNYLDTQYVQGYSATNGSKSAVLDQRLQAAAAWGF